MSLYNLLNKMPNPAGSSFTKDKMMEVCQIDTADPKFDSNDIPRRFETALLDLFLEKKGKDSKSQTVVRDDNLPKSGQAPGINSLDDDGKKDSEKTKEEVDATWTSLVAAGAEASSANPQLDGFNMKLKLAKVSYLNIEEIVAVLKSSVNIRHLDLSSNDLDHEDCVALVPLLKENTSLRSLDLSSNRIASEGMKVLEPALSENSCLRELSMEDCGLGQTAAKSLARVLQSDRCNLEGLYLAANPLGIHGAEALVPALLQNVTLRILGVQMCNIGNDGAAFLRQVFPRNGSLCEVVSDSNKIAEGNQDLKDIEAACKKNISKYEFLHMSQLADKLSEQIA